MTKTNPTVLDLNVSFIEFEIDKLVEEREKKVRNMPGHIYEKDWAWYTLERIIIRALQVTFYPLYFWHCNRLCYRWNTITTKTTTFFFLSWKLKKFHFLFFSVLMLKHPQTKINESIPQKGSEVTGKYSRRWRTLNLILLRIFPRLSQPFSRISVLLLLHPSYLLPTKSTIKMQFWGSVFDFQSIFTLTVILIFIFFVKSIRQKPRAASPHHIPLFSRIQFDVGDFNKVATFTLFVTECGNSMGDPQLLLFFQKTAISYYEYLKKDWFHKDSLSDITDDCKLLLIWITDRMLKRSLLFYKINFVVPF